MCPRAHTAAQTQGAGLSHRPWRCSTCLIPGPEPSRSLLVGGLVQSGRCWPSSQELCLAPRPALPLATVTKPSVSPAAEQGSYGTAGASLAALQLPSSEQLC